MSTPTFAYTADVLRSLYDATDLPFSPSHTESSLHTWIMAPILHSTMGVSGPDHGAGPFFFSPATNTVLSFESGRHPVRHLEHSFAGKYARGCRRHCRSIQPGYPRHHGILASTINRCRFAPFGPIDLFIPRPTGIGPDDTIGGGLVI